ncbi:MAG: HDOD domain-containing protein [Gammaproteobacteria bacterium]|nr:HDOD domain-containing protein [Gammaproteobacteria bacterium]
MTPSPDGCGPCDADPSRRTRLEVQKLSELPPMSAVARQFLEAIEDPDLEVRQMATIVAQDPALLGRLVGVANSAYFGFPEPIVTAEDAIFKVLGLNMAKNLTLSIVLSGPFDAERCRAFRPDTYWANAMTVAILAQRLAPMITVNPRPSTGDAYLAGLLHSIGVLALVHLFPGPMTEVWRAHAAGAGRLVQLEREKLGTDHCDVGGWLARKWRLPAQVVAVIERHMGDAPGGEHRTLVSLIRHCLSWTQALEAGTGEVSMLDLAELGIDAATVLRVTAQVSQRREAIRRLSQTLAYG